MASGNRIIIRADASEAILMEERPVWLIVDHYALEALEWAINSPRAVREMGIRAQSLMGNGMIEDNSLVRALCGEGAGVC